MESSIDHAHEILKIENKYHNLLIRLGELEEEYDVIGLKELKGNITKLDSEFGNFHRRFG